MEQANSHKNIYKPQILDNADQVHLALQAAGIGVWEVRLDSNTVSWDDECRKLFGLDKDNKLPYNEAVKHIHPDDVDAVNHSVQDALSGVNNGKYEMSYRTIGADDKKLRWVKFAGQAFFDEHNKPVRFAGFAYDITEAKQTKIERDTFEESDKEFKQLANSLSELVWTTDANGKQRFASRRWKEFTGLDPADEDTFQKIVHPQDLPGIIRVWSSCLKSGETYDTEVRLRRHTGEFYWFQVNGEPIRNEKGEIEKWVGTFKNINEQKKIEDELFAAFHELEESEATFNDVTNSSPTGLWLSDENGELTYLNKTLVEWTGMPYDSLLGAGWTNAVIEEDRETVAASFRSAVNSRSHYDVNFRIGKAGGDIVWCRTAGDPFYRDGVYKGYAGFCMDINETINFTLDIQAAEERFRSIVEQSPMAIGFLKERDMVIDLGNDKIFEVWDKDRSILGKKIIDALPEIKGQGFLELLQGVFDTGQPFFGNGILAKLVRNGNLNDVYFDFVYTPVRRSTKEIIGVMVLANEVTEQILAKKRLEETEVILRDAVELAELATWSIALDDHRFTCSERFSSWLGVADGSLALDDFYSLFEEDSRKEFKRHVESISKMAQHFAFFEGEYGLLNKVNKHVTVIHLHARLGYEEGRPHSIKGTAQDITAQKFMQIELERMVQLRTEELAASNEELAASNEELRSSNEELAITNEELSESTQQLIRSNDELSQYAYVASHDLQEPLRKIQTFSNRLMHESAKLDGEKLSWAEKINQSSARMSLLVRSLLEFSRLIKPEESFEQVDLNGIVKEVIKDYEVIIDDEKAEIVMQELPTIAASQLQMHQLFQNLISNALKFSKAGQHPEISIQCKEIDLEEMQKFVTGPITSYRFFHITIVDNGIGFGGQYAERIFEIFKRLHGQTEYKGSGIGLALCRKIVTNHNGYIFAESQPGEGSTFHVFLPSRT